MSQSVRAWVVCLTAGLFFFYEFIQMNMFNAVSAAFMHSFQLSAQMMGWIDSFYFSANVLFLLLAGYLLDQYSIRKVILSAMLLCVIGTIALSFTYTKELAMIFRFMTGIGSAFCFLSCIRLATHWFPQQRMGMVIGTIVTEAMIGGVFSQTPLTLLVRAQGWRGALLVDGLVGVVLWIIIFWVVRDRPDAHSVTERRRPIPMQLYCSGFKQAFLKAHNWLAACYTALINLPLALLGGIWGVVYLIARFHVDSVTASEVTTTLFVGMMIGSPIAGWVSDRFSSRRTVMLAGGVGMLLLLLILMQVSVWSLTTLSLLFFMIGLLSGVQVIGYPIVAEASPPAIIAMSVSVVNITTQACMGFAKPIFGWLMDKHARWGHHLGEQYTASDFHWAMWIFPFAVIVAMIATLNIKHQSKEEIEEMPPVPSGVITEGS